LKDETGPDLWQAEYLAELGEAVKTGQHVFKATASGHGIGKTALVAWIVHWFESTRPHNQAVVTANTGEQLLNKTWRELAKWHSLSINRDWFEWTATKFYFKDFPSDWFASAVRWSKEHSEAFAGTHEKFTLMIFDEASAIADPIWETGEGAMTTPGAIWLVFGNPTRNTGRFKECWGKFRNIWQLKQIDSRTAKKTDKAQLQRWIDSYGEDSDFVRVRVKGVFPRAASTQFISEEIVDQAMARGDEVEQAAYLHSPIVIGVDVARYGDDQSVILIRQGVYIHDIRKFREKSTVQIAGYVVESIKKFDPTAVFVDVIGIGAGVVDQLRHTGYNVIEVNSSDKPTKEEENSNLRAEMWANMRDWLKKGILPRDEELRGDLLAPEYGFDVRNRLQIERKEDMKARNLASPDVADALAMTFAAPVNPKRIARQIQAITEFDPLETEGRRQAVRVESDFDSI
jgi:hypothetical protein